MGGRRRKQEAEEIGNSPGRGSPLPSFLRATLFLGPQISSSSCWDSNVCSCQVLWSHFPVWHPVTRIAWTMTSNWATGSQRTQIADCCKFIHSLKM
jgi:hypothetical protein